MERGSGFLGEKEALKAFLADIFDKTDMKISLKTRIGLNRADEFDDILDIYQAFPVEMLIVHPRIRMDYYSGKPDMEAFEKASARMPFPVCYNGDIFTAAAYGRVSEKYSDIRHWMIGRGFCLIRHCVVKFEAGIVRPGKNWRIIIIQCGMNMKYACREIRKSFF